MFCPKCGSQNSDETTFCRGCGADLSNVQTAIAGKPRTVLAVAEKHIDLFSSGLRGLMIGLGFLIVSGVAFGISTRLAVLGLFSLAFAFFFLGTGVARLVQAKALKRFREPQEIRPSPALSPGEPEYIKPSRSLYETDDLLTTPRSVTEHTTTHLQMDPETFESKKE
jgi:hypothetical protein